MQWQVLSDLVAAAAAAASTQGEAASPESTSSVLIVGNVATVLLSNPLPYFSTLPEVGVAPSISGYYYIVVVW